MASPNLTHIALHVKDLDQSVAFYCNFAGMREIHRRDDKETNQQTAWVTTDAEWAPIHFVMVLLCGAPTLFGGARPQAPIGPVSHLGFAVDSRAEVDMIAQKAEALGILRRPPEYVNEVVNYICFVSDPDGHSVEFSYGQELGAH